jgi:hypothetical protein
LRDDRHGGDLEAAKPSRRRKVGVADGEPEYDERDSGRQGKTHPRHHPAKETRPQNADRDPELAAGRSGQELAERHELGIGDLVEPAPAQHVLVPEISKVRDRSAEGGEPEAQRDRQDLER